MLHIRHSLNHISSFILPHQRTYTGEIFFGPSCRLPIFAQTVSTMVSSGPSFHMVCICSSSSVRGSSGSWAAASAGLGMQTLLSNLSRDQGARHPGDMSGIQAQTAADVSCWLPQDREYSTDQMMNKKYITAMFIYISYLGISQWCQALIAPARRRWIRIPRIIKMAPPCVPILL
jgi:hypothetical protein